MAKKIKVKVFDELRESLQDALAFETKLRGRIHDTDLRVTELPPPPRKLRPRDIRAIRFEVGSRARGGHRALI